MQKSLFDVPAGGTILIDARNSDYIDPDILDLLADFKNVTAKAHGVDFKTVGLK